MGPDALRLRPTRPPRASSRGCGNEQIRTPGLLDCMRAGRLERLLSLPRDSRLPVWAGHRHLRSDPLLRRLRAGVLRRLRAGVLRHLRAGVLRRLRAGMRLRPRSGV